MDQGAERVKKAIYISGGITGVPNFEEAFAKEEARLVDEGWIVINPCHAFAGQDDVSYDRFMRLHIASILQVDAVVMLDGWEQSRGARFEKLMADMIGIPVYIRRVGRLELL